jgi:hypothetical protein
MAWILFESEIGSGSALQASRGKMSVTVGLADVARCMLC